MRGFSDTLKRGHQTALSGVHALACLVAAALALWGSVVLRGFIDFGFAGPDSAVMASAPVITNPVYTADFPPSPARLALRMTGA
jgi:hypothetical protein